MVFSNFILDTINSTLGKFVENLDESQFKVSLWSGNVEVSNLRLKPNVLDEFELPLKVVHGVISKLSLNIPWKNLYTQVTSVQIDGLYVIVAPKPRVMKKYSKDKELAAQLAAKQAELARLEKLKEKRTKLKKGAKEEREDNFVERLVIHVIKNFLVSVTNVHIRYEDVQHGQRFITAGLCLRQFSCQAAEGSLDPRAQSSASISSILKSLKVDSLSMYCNLDRESYISPEHSITTTFLRKNIVYDALKTDYTYILEPMLVAVTCKLNTHPEQNNYAEPQLDLDLNIPDAIVNIERYQYLLIMDCLAYVQRMALVSKYIKYRPSVPLHGHSKAWWIFAYNCIVDDVVRRHRSMWLWSNIKSHRVLYRKYKSRYLQKLRSSYCPADVIADIIECERKLDAFNIMLARQQAETQLQQKYGTTKEVETVGWFQSFFTGAKHSDDTHSKMAGALTERDKEQLYIAIGYSEERDEDYPITYVGIKVKVSVGTVKFRLRNPIFGREFLSHDRTEKAVVQFKHMIGKLKSREDKLFKTQLNGISVSGVIRPGPSAVRFLVEVESFVVKGLPKNAGLEPVLMVSCPVLSHTEALLNVVFETAPLDGACDIDIAIYILPLLIIYDAKTLRAVSAFLKPPDSVYLQMLQQAAVAKINEVKEMTVLGVQHLLEHHKKQFIAIKIETISAILPQHGSYRNNCRMMVVDMGPLNIKTESTALKPSDVKLQSMTLEELKQEAYDRLKLKLSRLQILSVNPDENWLDVQQLDDSAMHILKPLTIEVHVAQCIVKDPSVPEMIITSHIESVRALLSVERLGDIALLLTTFSMLDDDEAGSGSEVIDDLQRVNVDTVDMLTTLDDINEQKADKRKKSTEYKSYLSRIRLSCHQVQVSIYQILGSADSSRESTMLTLRIGGLGLALDAHTYDSDINFHLDSMSVQSYQYTTKYEALVNLFSCQDQALNTSRLLDVSVITADIAHPDFESSFERTSCKVSMQLQPFELHIDEAVTLNLIDMGNRIQTRLRNETQLIMDSQTFSAPHTEEARVHKQSLKDIEKGIEVLKSTERRLARKRMVRVAPVDFALRADIQKMTLRLTSRLESLAAFKVAGIRASLSVSKPLTTVLLTVASLSLSDLSSSALHRSILFCSEDQVMYVQIKLSKSTSGGVRNENTSVQLVVNTLNVYVLCRFIDAILQLLGRFQAALSPPAAAAPAAAAPSAAAAAPPADTVSSSNTLSTLNINISIHLPIIVLPQSYRSYNAILINLGSLAVIGRSEKISDDKNSDTPIVMQQIDVTLKDTQISRSEKLTNSVYSTSNILRPVTISVSLRLNLSRPDYHDEPLYDILCVVGRIEILLLDSDYVAVLEVLNDNIQDTQASSSQASEGQQPTGRESVVALQTNKAEPSSVSERQSVVAQSHTILLVKFILNGIQVDLAMKSKSVYLKEKRGADDDPLARFMLRKVSVDMLTKSDGYVKCDMFVEAVAWNDTRREVASSFTRGMVLSTRYDSNAKQTELLYVQFIKVQQPTKNIDVDVSVNNVHFTTAPSYLLMVANFFTKPLAAARKEPPAAPTVASPVQKSTAGKEQASSDDDNTTTTTVHFTLGLLEVVIIDDLLKEDTLAFTFKVRVDIEIILEPQEQTITGNVTNLSFSSANLLPAKYMASKIQIISPISIELRCTSGLHQKNIIVITISNIDVNLSASTFQLLFRLLNQLSNISADAQIKEDKESDKEQLAQLVQHTKSLWNVKPLNQFNFWFLRTNMTTNQYIDEADDEESEEKWDTVEVSKAGRGIIMQMRKLYVTLHFYGGTVSRPISFVHLQFSVRDMYLKSTGVELATSVTLTAEMVYYNEKLTEWEPVIEPVRSRMSYRPWMGTVQVLRKDQSESSSRKDQSESISRKDQSESSSDKPKPLTLLQPAMDIQIYSHDFFELTITKDCLQVLSTLGTEISAAIEGHGDTAVVKSDTVAPYVVKNDSGLQVKVKLSDDFKAAALQSTLKQGDTLQFYDNYHADGTTGRDDGGKVSPEKLEKRFHIMVDEFSVTKAVVVRCAEKRVFNLGGRDKEPVQLVCQTDAYYGSKMILLRSVVQIVNNLNLSLMIYTAPQTSAIELIGEVESNSVFNLPCSYVTSTNNSVHFQVKGYRMSAACCSWKGVGSRKLTLIYCEPIVDDDPPVYFTSIVTVESALFELSSETLPQYYVITLMPTVVIKNLLPVNVFCQQRKAEKSDVITSGSKLHLMNVNSTDGTNSVNMSMTYYDSEWTGSLAINKLQPKTTIVQFRAFHIDMIHLDLGICRKELASPGCEELALFCPYWMVNKTLQDLYYKAVNDLSVRQSPDFPNICMISTLSQDKKTTTLRIDNSAWSPPFSIDGAGTVGTIECDVMPDSLMLTSGTVRDTAQLDSSKNALIQKFHTTPGISCSRRKKPVKVKVTVTVKVASTGLTKIVIFKPFYTIMNQTAFTVLYSELIDNGSWYEIKPGVCTPFWPKTDTRKGLMVLSIKDTSLVTNPFKFTDGHSMFLRLDHEYGGIFVRCIVMTGSVQIVLQNYRPSMARVQLVNDTSQDFSYQQKNELFEYLLAPNEVTFYAWENPVKDRVLVWSCGSFKLYSNDLRHDGFGQVKGTNVPVYWVSFLDGAQRVLLLTENFSVTANLQQLGRLEQIDCQLTLALDHIGLSIVSSSLKQEACYIGVVSSNVTWERMDKNTQKILDESHSKSIEEWYQKYRSGAITKPHNYIPHAVEIDFAQDPILMHAPYQTSIVRVFKPAVWIKVRTAAHQIQVHFKIHHLQVDNQLRVSQFPTVFHPVPAPRTKLSNRTDKSFFELSVLIKKNEFSDISQYKYCKILVQEMSVEVEKDFLFALVSTVVPSPPSEQQMLLAFMKDCELMNVSLISDALESSAGDVQHAYDYLHISPLKVHISFSLDGIDPNTEHNDSYNSGTHLWSVLNAFIESLGIILTNMSNVELRLAYFERKSELYSSAQLIFEIIHHYMIQMMEEVYAFVFGLDIIGNPVSVVRGVVTGTYDMFYEPYSGALQGPEEFALGLAVGVASLVGHTIEGASTAVGKSFGAVGSGIAKFGTDERFQRSRREFLRRKPKTTKEAMARSGKRLLQDITEGLTGVITEPIRGARQGGVLGCVKGFTSGIANLVTKPTVGVLDFAARTGTGFGRAFATSEGEIPKLRPPRFLPSNGVVKPYCLYEATGNQVLYEIDNGKFTGSEYIGHIAASQDRTQLLFGTDQHLILTSKESLFANWYSVWIFQLKDLAGIPMYSNKQIRITHKVAAARQRKKPETVVVDIYDQDEWSVSYFCYNIARAMERTMR